MNKCLLLGCFPKVWKTVRVIVIPKTDKSKLHTVQGYRDISLLPIPGKCLVTLVVWRLNFFLENTGQIPPQQYGFTAGRSTADATQKVIESVHRGRKLGTKCCLLALDIPGAFNNAWHPAVLARLWEQKCPPNIYIIIKDFLLDQNAHIRLGDAISTKSVTKGCPQGSVSGPTLWDIIISGLIEILSKAPNLEIVTFADDILLIPRSHPPGSPQNGRKYSQHHRGLVQKSQAGDVQKQNGTNANVCKKKRDIQKPSWSNYTGNNRCLKNEIPRSYAGLKVRLVSPHTIFRKQATAYSKQPCSMLQRNVGLILL